MHLAYQKWNYFYFCHLLSQDERPNHLWVAGKILLLTGWAPGSSLWFPGEWYFLIKYYNIPSNDTMRLNFLYHIKVVANLKEKCIFFAPSLAFGHFHSNFIRHIFQDITVYSLISWVQSYNHSHTLKKCWNESLSKSFISSLYLFLMVCSCLGIWRKSQLWSSSDNISILSQKSVQMLPT